MLRFEYMVPKEELLNRKLLKGVSSQERKAKKARLARKKAQNQKKRR